ncbi:hypothetical protein LTR62_005395 [Meristemomyces frigidus]|uniref:Uncharacterized protein n=1 Tax=Meristemomyces frigidus TaxID=1508187 RepID=A0AAN7TEN0_9PEZI|nr:hypothetical protein LTR62_005395 [Meristemomyces frigidus]
MAEPSGENAQPNQQGSQSLFILSDQGRNTEESRRIVRAQAARASAAQSRVTRARNRGERESTVPSPRPETPSQSSTTAASAVTGGDAGPSPSSRVWPLAAWLPTVMGGAMGAVASQTGGLVAKVDDTIKVPAWSQLSSAAAAVPTSSFGGLPSFGNNDTNLRSPTETARFQLPLALPKGFTVLAQRIEISSTMLSLLQRTSCVDFSSPGVEQRLHTLLFDLIINLAGSALPLPTGQESHPLQGHLRVTCVCLTIYQGQRANGQVFAQDNNYNLGLDAAFAEATMLDKRALDEPKSAEASLWLMIMLTVTTGATATFFHSQILSLLRDLQLRYWEQVRKVLLDFIYPVSFLEAPCRSFYESLLRVQSAVG